jgi:uncharacterized protein
MADQSTQAFLTPISGKQRAWRVVKRVLRSILLMYVLVGIAMFAFQTKLIFPGAAYQGTPDVQVEAGAEEELVRLKTVDGTEVVGLFCRAEKLVRPGTLAGELAPPLPTVLFFYGNAMCVADATFVGDKFRTLGYHVMLVDYEGYGMSGGSPSEAGCYNAAEAAYRHVLTRADVDKKRIVMAGWSLGSAVAVEMAHRHRSEGTICALLTFSAFTSMVDEALYHYPYLPVSLVLRHRFMSGDKIKEITVPYFAGHGRHDSIIPAKFLPALVKAYGGKAEDATTYESASDHNDFFDDESGELMKKVGEFLRVATK